MANETGTLERIAEALANSLIGLADSAQPANLSVLLNELGIDNPPDLTGDAQLVQSLNDVLARAMELIPRVEELILAEQDGKVAQIVTAGAGVLAQCAAVGVALDAIGTRLQVALAGVPGGPELAAEFSKVIIGDVIARYLEAEHPLLRRLLTLGAVLEWDVVTRETDASSGVVRTRFHFDRLPKLLSDPLGLFELGYRWGANDVDASRLLQRISELFEPLDQIAAFGDEDGPPVPPVVDFGVFTLSPVATTPPSLGGELFLDADEDAVLPLAQLSDEFSVVLRLSGKFREGFTLQLVPPTKLELAPPPSGSLEGRLALEIVGNATDDSQQLFLLGIAGASRIEAKSVSAGIEAKGSWPLNAPQADAEVGLRAAVTDGRLIVYSKGADGFLADVLPKDGMNVGFDLEIAWDSTNGLHIKGGAGLTTNIPVHQSLGPIRVQAVNVSGEVGPSVLVLTGGITASVKLGPINAVIQDVGLRLALDFASNGNIGIADLDVGFKPPNGLGLTVDGGGFKGGGFLGFEPEEELYSGFFELQFQDQITLKAFGLLETHLPNGANGFSLLIIIIAEFSPIQLGFGFKLNSVGGLLGLNRTVNIEPLRTGLRDNTLSNILFPTDIVANATRILSDLKQVFPAAAGRFVFGPMARITWGTPTLLTIDLGLAIEVPEPVRLVILGVLRGILPDEQATILRLQVNFLGQINFEREELSFDASLFDSKLLSFTLSGDMALRLRWSAEANFLLTVGGFHPAYQPPPMNLPALRRLTLALLSGENPRLTLEMYFAVTSNTAQFGAKLELYAAAWKFNVYGFLSFDVLFQFNPFYFIAEVTAMLALRVGTSSFASIKLELTLEGPTPWKAKGTAKFKICWFFTLKIRFNKTFGEARNTTLPDLAVLPLLRQALMANDNWKGELPSLRHSLETVKEIAGVTEQVFVHPVGTLRISQKVVPLNIRIDRIGAQRPTDGREFRITDVQLPTTTIADATAVQESFAPAQFFDLSDEEKLASPSFKNLDSGVRVGDPERLHTAYAAARAVRYELKYIDSQRDQLPPAGSELFDVDAVAFNSWTLQGAIAQSELSFARTRKSNLAPDEVRVAEESFAIVNTADLQLFDEFSLHSSERAALARVSALLESNPALRGSIQVVPAFELIA